MRRRVLFPALSALLGVSSLCFAQIAGVTDLTGKSADPFTKPSSVRVLLFVRTDCPITNRYAPELQRIAREYEGRGVQFWLVYADRSETTANIEQSIAAYHFPGRPLRDMQHALVKRAHALTAPEAAVFDGAGNLAYHGRIDDWYVDIGKSRPTPQVHDLEDAIAAVLDKRPVRQPETRAVGCSLADLD